MEKSSEGVVINSLDSELDALTQQVKELNSLPTLARMQFVNHIKLAVGNLDDPYLPDSLKPVLSNLLERCSGYLNSGNETTFIPLCEHAIWLSSQGWSHLSYWICSEQALCYQIFWGLKDALAKYRKLLGMYDNCCNDGTPKKQFYRLPLRNLST